MSERLTDSQVSSERERFEKWADSVLGYDHDDMWLAWQAAKSEAAEREQALVAEVERLRDLLRERDGGTHDMDCPAHPVASPGRPCKCGHDEAMEALAQHEASMNILRIRRGMAMSDPLPRLIVCAAMRYSDGLIICSPRHFDQRAHDVRQRIPDLPSGAPEQGFVDQRGAFLTREEAREVAISEGQMRRRCGGDERKLFSENLY